MPDSRARTQAQRILGGQPVEDRELLEGDPLTALAGLGFTVRFWPETSIGGTCSVHGSYEPGPPPVLNVVETASVGRRVFTALHEYGHVLVAADTAVHDVFAGERDGGVRLEEQICDAIAAEILLPDDLVDVHIGPAGPSAPAIVGLFEASQASREACCVRAAQRINGVGHIMLAVDGTAQFTASKGTIYGVRRATRQIEGHITTRALGRLSSIQEHASISYASGAVSDRYFAEAYDAGDGYVFAVFVESNPPWRKDFTVPDADPGDEVEAYCTWCETDFTTKASPCPNCEGYVHWDCGKCSCQPKTRDRLCDQCFIRRPLSDFSTGSAICKVCLGE